MNWNPPAFARKCGAIKVHPGSPTIPIELWSFVVTGTYPGSTRLELELVPR